MGKRKLSCSSSSRSGSSSGSSRSKLAMISLVVLSVVAKFAHAFRPAVRVLPSRSMNGRAGLRVKAQEQQQQEQQQQQQQKEERRGDSGVSEHSWDHVMKAVRESSWPNKGPDGGEQEQQPVHPNWQSKFITVGGVKIHYKDTGKAQGKPTLVMIHGLGGSTASFDEIVPALDGQARVIAFDRPAFGWTERVLPPALFDDASLPWTACTRTGGANPYLSDWVSRALWTMLDRLGIKEAIFVAHSLGSHVALRAVALKPDRVMAVVLLAPALMVNPLERLNPLERGAEAAEGTFYSEDGAQGQERRGGAAGARRETERPSLTAAAAGRLGDVYRIALFNMSVRDFRLTKATQVVRSMTMGEDLIRKVQRNFHDPSVLQDKPHLVNKYLAPLRERHWDRGLMYFYRAIQTEAQAGMSLLQDTLDLWQGPALVITGRQDQTIPLSNSASVAGKFEQGRLHVVEECGHIPMDERAAETSCALVSFINSFPVKSAVTKASKPNGQQSQ